MNFILTFLLLTQLYSEKLCDCYFPEDLASAQKFNYEESGLIFLGKIVERNDDGSFKFEVLETLKGEELDM